ncbi:MAG: hypothetical protein J1G06_06665 [Oscillospiraceae bacterium]|nr:hypothetical protein [Oscillospiraceae bacterium]
MKKQISKKYLYFVVMVIGFVLLGLSLTGCSSKNESTRNPDFTYGAYNWNIENVYNLTGKTEVFGIYKMYDKLSMGKSSATSDGGWVVWNDYGQYVYSPDASDREDLKTEIIRITVKKHAK